MLEEHRNVAQVVYNFFIFIQTTVFFLSPFFVGFSHDYLFRVMFFVPNLIVFFVF